MAEKKVKVPKIKLFRDHILTTVEYIKQTEGGVLLGDGEKGVPLTEQVVVACGPTSGVEVGDKVEINFAMFPTRKTLPAHGIGPDKESIILPLEKIDGGDYFYISSREVKWKYNEGAVKGAGRPKIKY